MAPASRPLIIGRGPEADFRLEAPGLSKRHASLTPQGGGRFLLTDLGSVNGVFVDSRRVQSAVVGLNDVIYLADQRLSVAAIVGRGDQPAKTSRFSIGRSSDNDIVLNEAGVSRRHAVLEYAGGAWYLGDAGSQNGTFVNSRPITAAEAITEADRLKFGRYEVWAGELINQTRRRGAAPAPAGLEPNNLNALREAYIQKDGPKYARLMAAMDAGSWGGFDFSAAFFSLMLSPVALFHRKLYRHAHALYFCAGSAVLTLLLAAFVVEPQIEVPFGPAFDGAYFFLPAWLFIIWAINFTVPGLLSRRWLKEVADREIQDALAAAGDAESARRSLAERGGLNIRAVVMGISAYAFIALAIFAGGGALGLNFNIRPAPNCNASNVQDSLRELLGRRYVIIGGKDFKILNIRTKSAERLLKICSATAIFTALGQAHSEDVNYRVYKESEESDSYMIQLSME